MKRPFQHGLMLVILTWVLAITSPAHAATGSSQPTFLHPVLTIPRIDVEGYGSLNLRLVLENDKTLIFAIAAATPAAGGLTPGATFNLQTQKLDIPVVQVGSQFYRVQLQLLPGDKFQISMADQAVFAGQASYNAQCSTCHGTDGLGGSIGISMKNCATCTSASVLTAKIANTMPLGNPSACVGTCATDIANYILTVFNAAGGSQGFTVLAAIDTMPLATTLRNASLQLVSRLPTSAEEALVTTQGEDGLRQALGGMMKEEAFYDRLSEIFNDMLHTNRYLSTNGTEAALQLMGRFPTARWFDPGVDLRDRNYQLYRITTNNSVATEPLELINHVVKNNLPMTEILTADYFMVNGYSAKSYGIRNVTFTDEWDANEFRPARLNNIPHAGILSSLMFLNRYPTSATNRNRARSRVVYDLFLDVDILALDGARPDGTAVDISRPSPTLNNPDCVKCHTLLDPVASSFRDWNLRGTYTPNAAWYTDMLQAGFGSEVFPARSTADELQWLTKQVVADPRFDDAILRIVFHGLMGQDPLDPPGDGAITAERDAWLAQSTHLNEIKAKYVAANRNLKTLITELILSPYWRAQGLNDAAFALVHEETGAARLLTPEMLHRRIEALFGFQWRGPLDQYAANLSVFSTARLLDSRLYYQQIYGGIDSFVITERLSDPNGLMVFVQERMANEMACYGVPNDFLAPASQRRLFPHVATSTDLTGSQGVAAVRRNIQHLHRYLLGEDLALTDAEIEHTYALFTAVLQGGRAALSSRAESSALPARCMRNNELLTGTSLNVNGTDGRLRNDPDYTLRAWMAVVAYLLSDYRFIYA